VKDKLARLTKASKNLTLRLQHQVIVEKRWSVFEGENARFDEVTKEELAARTKTLDVSMLCAGPARRCGLVYKYVCTKTPYLTRTFNGTPTPPWVLAKSESSKRHF